MASIIFGTTLDMLTVATPSSGAYIVAYDLDGILKQKDEFGVITEIGGGPTGGSGLTPSLSDVMNISNITDSSLIMGTMTSILSSNGGGRIDLDYSGASNSILLSSDNGSQLQGRLYLTSTEGTFGFNATFIKTTDNDIAFRVDKIQQFLIKNNSTASVFSSGLDKYGSIISSKLSEIEAGVINSVVIGGQGLTASSNDTVYVQNLNINNNFTLPNVDGSNGQSLVTDGSGNISWGISSAGLADVLSTNNDSGVNSIIMGTSTSILSSNGGGQIDLDYGSTSSISLSTDNGSFLKSYLILDNSDIIIDASGSLSIGASAASVVIDNLQGLVYGFDYSSTFVNNSLVSKIYVDTGTNSIWSAIDNINNDVITGVTAGAGLTGGGSVGDITIDVNLETNSGLTFSGDNITLELNSNSLEVDSNNQIRLKDTIIGSRTFTDSVIISGDLTVSGTATYVNTEELYVADNIITLNATYSSGTPFLDAGINVLRGSSQSSSIIWNETIEYWQVGLSGSESTIITEAGSGLTKSNNQLEVDFGTVSSISYVDAGTASLWAAIDNINNDYITEVIGGQGLTGGGTAGIVTLDAQVNNGLSITSDYIGLGGTLSQNTTINGGGYDITLGGIGYLLFTSSTFDVETDFISLDSGTGSTQILSGSDMTLFSGNSLDLLANNGVYVVGSSFSVNSVEIDPTSATTGQALVFDGVKFSPSTLSGDISGITAGAGLTGGGSTGYVTLDAQVNNGLSITSDYIGLGGSLNKFTTITQGGNTMSFVGGNVTMGGSVGIGTSSTSPGYVLNANGNVVIGETGVNTLLSFLGPNVDLTAASANYININTGYRIRFYTYSTLMAQFDTSQSIFYGNVSSSGTMSVDGNLIVDTDLIYANSTLNNVGIGTSNPNYKLEVSGTVSTTGFRMTDGAASGYILTSDNNGVASWTSLPTSTIKLSDIRNFTASVAETITHTLNTEDLIIQTYDSTGLQIIPDSIQINGTASIDVTISQTLSNVKTVIIG